VVKIRLRDKLKSGIGIVRSGILKQKFPLSVTFIATNRCNLRCSYCTAWKRKIPEMTTEQIKSMIKQFADIGTKNIGFVGGEPLLRDDIGEIVTYAKKQGMYTTTTTNAVLIPEKIDELKDMDLFLISIDGPASTQQKTKHNEAEEILEIFDLLKSRNKKVWSSTVLTANTINNIDFVVDMAKKHKFRALFQPLAEYPLATVVDPSLFPKPNEFERAISYLIKLKKRKLPIANTTPYLRFIKKYPDGAFNRCLAGISYCYIDSNGDVYPCHGFLDKLKVLNGTEVGFRKAFYQMPSFNCQGCNFPCYHEKNLLYKLNPHAIANALKVFS